MVTQNISKTGIFWVSHSCPLTDSIWLWAMLELVAPRVVVVQLLSPVWLFETHGLQYNRLPCPLPSPRACSNSYALSRWYHPTISSSATSFFFCFQSFPESFPVNQLFIAGGQSIRASASGLPMNIQSWFPLGLTGLISLLSKGLSSIFSRTPIWKHQFFGAQLSLWSNSCIHTWLLGKTIILTIWTFVVKVMFLLFNTLSRFVLVKVHQKKTRWLFPITQKSAEELDGYFL